MDSSTTFLVLLGIIVANQLVMRMAALKSSPWFFWGLQFLNLALVTWIFASGLPGFEMYPWISWAIGLWFTFRIITNNGERARFLRGAAQMDRKERERKVESLLSQMRENDKKEDD